MNPAESGQGSVLLDACVAINLIASGALLNECSLAFGRTFVMAELAAAETLYLADPSLEDQQASRPLDLAALVRQGHVTILVLSESELESFVEFASEVDDGEAASIAIARHRIPCFASDDRKARRVAALQGRGIEIIGTTGILRAWSEQPDRGPSEVATALRRVEERARFVPPRDDPHFAWWNESIRRAR